MSHAAQQDTWVSTADYLLAEQSAPLKHEYIAGQVYAMAGASVNHNRITANIMRMFGNHLYAAPCQPYASDLKVHVAGNYFYPDVVVDCTDLSGQSSTSEQPILLIEVLSKSTRRTDETIKRFSYKQINSLQEYILIEQDIAAVEVLRRAEGWQSVRYFLGDLFYLASIDYTVSVADLYYRVDNEDVAAWLDDQSNSPAPISASTNIFPAN